MSTIFDYGRLSWTVKRLNKFMNDPKYNLEAILNEAEIDYNEVVIFLKMANKILNKEVDFKKAFDQCGVDVEEITILAEAVK